MLSAFSSNTSSARHKLSNSTHLLNPELTDCQIRFGIDRQSVCSYIAIESPKGGPWAAVEPRKCVASGQMQSRKLEASMCQTSFTPQTPRPPPATTRTFTKIKIPISKDKG